MCKSRRVSTKVIVRGLVQGVSFRASLHERAIHHRVDGWVRNREDGSVEALLQGDEDAVRRVVEWTRFGPPRAKVSAVTEETLVVCPRQRGFRIID
ncbi:MAG: acylphosphatase [Thaumarchaeota archaeon]|nr:acylphosphatase [Nitrososphaerota archaeon]